MEDTKGDRPTSVSYSKLNLEYIDAASVKNIDEVISINDQVEEISLNSNYSKQSKNLL
ncbi:uncharacterized protein NESG_01992 [Nematocida ausubeli]|uniref:Uncharacterized protein n=1 Tax=Nematocida ausubeli (strain ATCC PRA-371 / ERTm2) TaxID=1913371 RepID=A0A086IZA5_NEMA1|nr:uncharacterized protein NESG_01992 [Nematocida ausubeli]KAI5139835.1 hypothetical protein NEAUS06_2654 [Nematocida ausubeli]KFG25223.1 hypothetical protein NESG_01992 [Nematocida ausubeli]